MPPLPHVVIVGGGFGGIAAAKALAHAPLRVTLLDRRNHHVFQPLLYQVATAALSPAQIASPIRRILTRQRNTTVLLAEVRSIDAPARRVALADASLDYDYLILAAGATHSYSGHDDWAPLAPGLKTIDDAIEVRKRFLLAFERAEREPDPARRRDHLTFAVVGAGPTGVELAGSMIEMARHSIPRDFRSVDTTAARVILIEAQDRVLPSFSPDLSARALSHLHELGVEVHLSTLVTNITADAVRVRSPHGERSLPALNVLWAAGVSASPLGATLPAPRDHAGRVLVGPDLSVPGLPEVFVVGDLACVTDPRTGAPVPGVAQAAMQMGRHAGRVIAAEARDAAPPGSRPPFAYRDPGTLATIGRAKAVAQLPRAHFAGLWAWLLWVFIHILWLINFRSKLIVLLEWAWAYIVYERGARLITGEGRQPPTTTP
jgi:NADH:ubiquinone reductase (H+-translocating)